MQYQYDFPQLNLLRYGVIQKLQSVPNSKERRLYILTKMFWIKASETSIVTLLLRHQKIIKLPYCISLQFNSSLVSNTDS